MEINKENYEAYLLDLWEGNLSEERKVMLYRFLEKNPEYNEDDALGLLGDISIMDSEVNFDKSSIDFEHINSKNYEYFFTAYAEGDLSKDEMNLVDDFLIEHPELNKKFTQFNAARLPIETIKHPSKEKLVLGKTRIISIQSRRWFMGIVAASIAFLMWFILPTEEPNYLYTMSDSLDLQIEKYKPDSFIIDSKSVVNSRDLASENKYSDKNYTPNAPAESKRKIINRKEVVNEDLANLEIEKIIDTSHIANKNNSNTKNDLIHVSQLEIKEISEVIASVALLKESELKKAAAPSQKFNQKIPTIIDLTAEYLQRKNLLTEERKPDLKGIINNTLSNRNEKPIIYVEDNLDSKTTIFELGNLKIERKARK